MIKIQLSLLESIKDFFVGLGALLVVGFFGIVPILIVLSVWFPSLMLFTEELATGGFTVILALLALVIVFFFLCAFDCVVLCAF